MTPDELRTWRKARRLTQLDLSIHVGLSLETIKRYEAGKSPIPTLLKLYCEEH